MDDGLPSSDSWHLHRLTWPQDLDSSARRDQQDQVHQVRPQGNGCGGDSGHLQSDALLVAQQAHPNGILQGPERADIAHNRPETPLGVTLGIIQPTMGRRHVLYADLI